MRGRQDAHEINRKLQAALFLIEESALEVGHAGEHLPAKLDLQTAPAK